MGAVAERKAAWVADYLMMVEQCLTPEQMAARFGMSVDTFRTRVRRYGCRAYNSRELHAKQLLDGWVERRWRFTEFDFPFHMPRSEVVALVKEYLADGLIVKFGKVPVMSKEPIRQYGHPDSLPNVSRGFGHVDFNNKHLFADTRAPDDLLYGWDAMQNGNLRSLYEDGGRGFYDSSADHVRNFSMFDEDFWGEDVIVDD